MNALPEPVVQKLVVRKAEPAATGIQRFELERPDHGDLPRFTPGAHLHVKAPNGLLRRYSLCNDPDDASHYEFAVKREAEGTGGSRSLVDDVKQGDTLEVSAPSNDFALSATAPSHIFIAGGIGITPFMSMARHLAASAGRPFRLFYLGRAPDMMAFAGALAAPEFKGRVVMYCDGGDPGQAFDLWPVLEKPKGAHIYCCGPRGLMEAVRDMTGHWPTSAVHFEDFGTRPQARADDTPFTVRLARTGATIEIPAGVSILDRLRAEGIAVSSSCESGSCGTCRVGLLGGEADHRDLVLAEHEKHRNIMICVSRAASGELVLDL